MTAADDHSPAARLEALDAALDALTDAAEVAPILVEGLRDVDALRALGIARDVRVLNRGEALIEVVETLRRESIPLVILLMDWDRTGGRLQRRLRDLLESHGLRVDDSHRLALIRVAGNEARSVESLARVRERLQADVEGARLASLADEQAGD